MTLRWLQSGTKTLGRTVNMVRMEWTTRTGSTAPSSTHWPSTDINFHVINFIKKLLDHSQFLSAFIIV